MGEWARQGVLGVRARGGQAGAAVPRGRWDLPPGAMDPVSLVMGVIPAEFGIGSFLLETGGV